MLSANVRLQKHQPDMRKRKNSVTESIKFTLNDNLIMMS